jgi:hypothetical protein
MRDRFRDNWDGANHVSLGFLDVLTLIFITLKLTDVINWSWWAVLSPIWVQLVLIIITVIVLLILKYFKKI